MKRLRAAAMTAASLLAALLPGGASGAPIDLGSGGQAADDAATWPALRPEIVALADRVPALVLEATKERLPTPVMHGEGGANYVFEPLSVFSGRPMQVANDQWGETRELFEWVSRHMTGNATKEQVERDYVQLAQSGEAQLRARGLPVDSLGSAIYYELTTDFEVAGARQTLTPEQDRTLRGFVVVIVALLESGDRCAGRDGREFCYQRTLVGAEELRRGQAASNAGSSQRQSYREAASSDLRQLGIDPSRDSLDRIVCAFKGALSCSSALADSTPVFEKLAAEYPF